MKTSFLLREITPYLREAYGSVQGLAQLQEGDESQAFAATVNGRELVIRIASHRHGFDKDNLAASRWPEVLAPEIVDIAPFRGAWLCLSARAPGTTLQSLGLKARNSAQSVCTMLDSIAGADIGFVSGFGPFDAGGTAPYSSWRQFIVDVEGPANWCRLLTDFDYGTRRALVHGDFGSNNVLAIADRVSAVLDWSEALAGDPLYDLANLFFWRSWLDCMEAQCAYVEAHEPHRLSDPARLLRYQLQIGLKAIAAARADKDSGLIDWATARCATIARSLGA